MTLIWAPIATAVAAGLAIAAMLRVRRNAPDGGYFNDGDRAAGVFGVLATGFAILLGFVVFLAFESYDESRSGAETEAVVVTQQFKTAQFMPDAVSGDLADDLVCYGRSVVDQEWPRMDTAAVTDGFNPWGVEMFRVLERADPKTATEQTAFDKWLDQTIDREQARSDRIHGAEGVIPNAVWVALGFMALLIFTFMLFFADSGERAVVQGLMIGAVVSMMVVTLAVIRVLDDPFGSGGLKPVAMERTLTQLEQARKVVGATGPLPCDTGGRALTASRRTDG
jgi:hypothetical protein